MSDKLLYIIGAGASANALPLVKDSPNNKVPGLRRALKSLHTKLWHNENPMHGFSTKFLLPFCNNLQWLYKESESYSSIDTYAKYLYEKRDYENFDRLKFTLSIFFILEQFYKNKQDKRYASWVTSLLKKQMFPKNINILSWNYDFQIQRAASEYKQEHSHHGEGAYMKRSPLIEYYPPIGNHFPLSTPDYDLNEFRLVHLNGIAGFFHKEDIHHIENFFNNTDSIVSAMNSMIDSPEKFKHLLTFAFETQQGRTGIGRRIEVAKSAAMDTTTIVIIGYSFPFFNSEVDKTIFEVLKESGKLKTIYVQDPSMDVKKIYRQFNLDSSTVEIEAIKSTESFFIPPEFSPIYIFD